MSVFQEPLAGMGEPGKSSEASVRLEYAGDAVAGEIGAKDLALGLTSLAELMDSAHSAGLLGDAGKPSLKVRSFDQGSFDVIAVLQWMTEYSAGLVLATTWVAGAMQAIGKIRNHVSKRVVSHQTLPNGYEDVTFSNGEMFVFTAEEWELFRQSRTKKALRNLVAPIGAGISTVSIASGGGAITFDQSDRDSLMAVDNEEIPDEVRQVWVTPSRVDLDSGEHWGVRINNEFHRVKIEDQSFLRDIDTAAVSIKKTDRYLARIRTETTIDSNGNPKQTLFLEEIERREGGASQDELPQAGGMGPSA